MTILFDYMIIGVLFLSGQIRFAAKQKWQGWAFVAAALLMMFIDSANRAAGI